MCVALFPRDVTTKTPVISTKAVETIVKDITSSGIDGLTFQMHSSEVTRPVTIKSEIDNKNTHGQINAIYYDDVVHIIAPKKNTGIDINAQKSPCRNKGFLSHNFSSSII